MQSQQSNTDQTGTETVMWKALVTFATVAVAAIAFLASPIGAALSQESRWSPSGRFGSEERPSAERNIAGAFDYYTLVLSWSPSYCATADQRADDTQCNRRDGRRYAFVLHGLWPQYEKGYPESCRLRRRPFVPQDTIERMLDIMPARGLIIHEYRKHGTCSGLDPNGYFSLARRLFQSIRIPERFINPFEAQYLSPRDVVSEFVRINPGLRPDMMAVNCSRTAKRLSEIRICFSKDGKLRSCGENESQRRMCSMDTVFVPPVRSTTRGGDFGNRPLQQPGERQSPLPMPRLIEGQRGI